jgi:2-methylaconitate isomerase
MTVAQEWTRASFMRGGTSKGLFFHNVDMPSDLRERDGLFLRMLGSPDPYGRQLDGMGGGISSLSKVVVISSSTRSDADVEFTFGQVAVDEAIVDYSANCGNLSAAVAPFAIDEKLCQVPDGSTTLRLFNTNTQKVIHATLRVRGGFAETEGDLALPGVAGTGSPIKLTYVDPAGARTGRLFPTGNRTDTIQFQGRPVAVSLVDATGPVVMLRAVDFGMKGTESPSQLDADLSLMESLEAIRREAAVMMGLADTPASAPLASPKVAILATPESESQDQDLVARVVSMGRIHQALPGTTAMCIAVSQRIQGTLPELLAKSTPDVTRVRLSSPAGVIVAGSDVSTSHENAEDQLHIGSASIYRSARTLMRGWVGTNKGQP